MTQDARPKCNWGNGSCEQPALATFTDVRPVPGAVPRHLCDKHLWDLLATLRDDPHLARVYEDRDPSDELRQEMGAEAQRELDRRWEIYRQASQEGMVGAEFSEMGRDYEAAQVYRDGLQGAPSRWRRVRLESAQR
ncbi:MAG: hypothetical protein ACRDJK_03830 [Actinomycetota bacterium]